METERHQHHGPAFGDERVDLLRREAAWIGQPPGDVLVAFGFRQSLRRGDRQQKKRPALGALPELPQLNAIRLARELPVVRDLVLPHRELAISRQLETELRRRRRHRALRANESAQRQRHTKRRTDVLRAHSPSSCAKRALDPNARILLHPPALTGPPLRWPRSSCDGSRSS